MTELMETVDQMDLGSCATKTTVGAGGGGGGEMMTAGGGAVTAAAAVQLDDLQVDGTLLVGGAGAPGGGRVSGGAVGGGAEDEVLVTEPVLGIRVLMSSRVNNFSEFPPALTARATRACSYSYGLTVAQTYDLKL